MGIRFSKFSIDSLDKGRGRQMREGQLEGGGGMAAGWTGQHPASVHML